MVLQHEGPYRHGRRRRAGVQSDRHGRNVGDVTQAQALLPGQEEQAFGDAGYIGVKKRPEVRPGRGLADGHEGRQAPRARHVGP